MNIITEIAKERIAQDEQWGGAAHDDTHTPKEWIEYINHQIGRAKSLAAYLPSFSPSCDGMTRYWYRKRLVKTAALCIAAIEAMDRAAELQPQKGT